MGKSKNKKRKNPDFSGKSGAKTQAAKSKTAWKKLLFLCGGLLLLVGLVLAAVLPLRASGFFLRRKTVAETPHYRVDGAMYSYYFYSSLYDELAGDNAEIYKRNGITEKTDLRKATYGDGKSWFDFFESVSSSRLQSILQYAEAAADGGVSLSEEGQDSLEKTVSDLRAKATAAGLSFDRYLAERFGTGVKEKDVRGFLSLYLLAGEAAEKAKDDLDVTGEEIERLRQDREFSLSASRVSFFYYICKAPKGASASDAEKAEAKANAERLCAISDPQSFINEVRRQEEHLASHTGEELTSELFDEIRDDFSYLDVPYSAAVLIDEKIEARKAKESVLFAEEKTGSYGVLLVIEPLHIDETPSYQYRKVTFSDATAAAAVMGELCGNSLKENGPDSTGHSSADASRFLSTAKDGGGRDAGGIENGTAADAENETLAAWLRDEKRQVGDLLLQASDTPAIWYFGGKGLTAFEKAARNRILNEKYEEIDSQTAEKYASVTVKESSGKAVAKRRGLS